MGYSKEQAIKQIKEILATHDIRIDIDGCGCCGSPWLKFEYEGVIYFDDLNAKINMFEGNEKDQIDVL